MTDGTRSRSSRAGAYPGSWLAIKLGIEPRELDVRRRSGELLAVRSQDGRDYLYPAWQFDANGRPYVAVARVVAAGRAAGLTDDELFDLLERRDGMTSTRRLWEYVRDGREERVLDVIRTAPRS
ncbi:MAG: hypothetical protein ICV74_00385 [Thermoleophilia bacterium]|nr:hypothetical protein [Thermoleophilia bacterium]